jgi:hypothetical protein
MMRGCGDWERSRKKRVSEPAPRERICLVGFWGLGGEEKKRDIRWSRIVVRT